MTDAPLVHVVDDDDAVRDSMAVLLHEAGYAIETYPSGRAFLGTLLERRPGCILLDFRMPVMDGLAVQRSLIERAIKWPVIMLTAHGDVATAVQAMKAGAIDFIEKPYESAALFSAIERGCDRLNGMLDLDLYERDARARIEHLSRRERDVLSGLVAGQLSKTIAHRLGISPRTVEVHRAHMMAKLGTKTLSEALRIAIVAGLAWTDGRRHGARTPDGT